MSQNSLDVFIDSKLKEKNNRNQKKIEINQPPTQTVQLEDTRSESPVEEAELDFSQQNFFNEKIEEEKVIETPQQKIQNLKAQQQKKLYEEQKKKNSVSAVRAGILKDSTNIQGKKNIVAVKIPEQKSVEISQKQSNPIPILKKKIPMWKTVEPSKIKILWIGLPQAIKNTKIFKKVKYQLKFNYEYIDRPGKALCKTIRLGDFKNSDQVDMNQGEANDDRLLIAKRLSKLKNYKNPMHTDFWTYHLLNQGNNIGENYLKLVNKLKLV